MIWRRVIATHEESQVTSTGPWPGDDYPGIALPSTRAIWLWVEVRNPINGKTCIAQVRDVGPWFTNDHDYVFEGREPMAVVAMLNGGSYDMDQNKPGIQYATVGGKPITKCNGAGIDLFPETAEVLGIQINKNQEVEWRFLENQPPRAERAIA